MIYWREMKEGLKKAEQTAFARKLLLDALKLEYGMQYLPEIAVTPSGKPYFPKYPELHFNYSHSKRTVACILSKQAAGIDLEQIRKYHEKTAERFCSKAEWNWLQGQSDRDQAWIRLWTIKEAWVKYEGMGIRMELQNLDFSDILKQSDRQGKKQIAESGEIRPVYINSFFIEDFWISVCGTEENNNHVLHL